MKRKTEDSKSNIYSQLALCFLTYIIIFKVCIRILSLFNIAFFDSGIGYQIRTFGFMYLVAFPVFLFMSRKIPNSKEEKTLNDEKFKLTYYVKYFFLGKFASTVGLTISVFLFSNYFMTTITSIPPEDNPSVLQGIIQIIMGCFIGPIIEEIIFRWVPYKKLGKTSANSYILFCSICFGLCHLNPIQSFSAFFSGIVFSYIMYRYKNIIYPIVLHVIMNLSLEIVDFLKIIHFKKLAKIISTFNKFSPLIGLTVFLFIILNKIIKKQTWSHSKINIKEVLLNKGTIIYIVVTSAFIILIILG